MTTVKAPLVVSENTLDVAEPSPVRLAALHAKLEELNAADRKRAEREAARNALESFALDIQDKFYQDEFEKATTEEERTSILADCSTVTEWLYEGGFEADAAEFKTRLLDLRTKTKDIFDRVNEHRHRPEVLEYLESSLASAKNFSDQVWECF